MLFVFLVLTSKSANKKWFTSTFGKRDKAKACWKTVLKSLQNLAGSRTSDEFASHLEFMKAYLVVSMLLLACYCLFYKICYRKTRNLSPSGHTL
jgi:hypothetical protein